MILRIRELTEAPVMVLTALGENVDQVRELDIGAEEHVIKLVSSRARTCATTFEGTATAFYQTLDAMASWVGLTDLGRVQTVD